MQGSPAMRSGSVVMRGNLIPTEYVSHALPVSRTSDLGPRTSDLGPATLGQGVRAGSGVARHRATPPGHALGWWGPVGPLRGSPTAALVTAKVRPWLATSQGWGVVPGRRSTRQEPSAPAPGPFGTPLPGRS
jgi:hypothetical protein